LAHVDGDAWRHHVAAVHMSTATQRTRMSRRVTQRSTRRTRLGSGIGVLLVSAIAATLGATSSTAGQSSATSSVGAPVTPPFGVGERAEYRASWGVLGRVGTGAIRIDGVDTVRGREAYHVVFTIRGGIPGARVDNRFESWLDRERLHSHRFVQQTREVRFRRDRTREFFPDELRWTGRTNTRDESGELTTSLPLDETSFLYYLRTMDLEVGREYTLDRYWNPDGNPVRIRVLRRETVRVPAGTYRTIVVQPIIRTSGLFSEGGEAEVYFSEGPTRELVMLTAKMSIGTLRLQLEKFEPAARQAAPAR
jgi:hypothetical protein